MKANGTIGEETYGMFSDVATKTLATRGIQVQHFRQFKEQSPAKMRALRKMQPEMNDSQFAAMGQKWVDEQVTDGMATINNKKTKYESIVRDYDKTISTLQESMKVASVKGEDLTGFRSQLDVAVKQRNAANHSALDLGSEIDSLTGQDRIEWNKVQFKQKQKNAATRDALMGDVGALPRHGKVDNKEARRVETANYILNENVSKGIMSKDDAEDYVIKGGLSPDSIIGKKAERVQRNASLFAEGAEPIPKSPSPILRRGIDGEVNRAYYDNAMIH